MRLPHPIGCVPPEQGAASRKKQRGNTARNRSSKQPCNPSNGIDSQKQKPHRTANPWGFLIHQPTLLGRGHADDSHKRRRTLQPPAVAKAPLLHGCARRRTKNPLFRQCAEAGLYPGEPPSPENMAHVRRGQSRGRLRLG